MFVWLLLLRVCACVRVYVYVWFVSVFVKKVVCCWLLQ